MVVANKKLRGTISGSGSVSGKASTTIYYTDAYNIAVAHGFRGTVEEWLESLKGEPGAVQTVNGFAPDENGNVEIKIPEGGGTVTDEQIAEAVEKYLEENPPKVTESDPTVPDWAKEETKPSYSKSEVGLGNVDNVKQYSASNPPPYPVASVNGQTGKVHLGAGDVGARPSNWMPTAQEVGALPDTYVPPDQTAAQVGADPAGTAAAAVSAHNTSTESHGDLRLELKAINDRLTAFFDSDNQTLDELSEIVAYITSNKALIDSITTSKVSVADIVNNLTTNVANKPLSAAQGVVLSGLIDTLSKKLANYQPKGDYALRSEIPTVPSKVSAFTNDAGYLTQHQDISGKVNKNGLTLGIHTDGLVYVFVDGVPVGNGIEMGASGDVFGYVDENNNIVVQGNLPDGTYSVKYEMEDGSTVNIGNLVLDTNVYYSVTNTLTNCTNGNSATQVVGGESYSATISANSGYVLSSVVVTMGGTDVSADVVSGGNISIAEVKGNIVITAVAEEVQAAEPVTVDIALTDGIRIGSDGGDRTVNGMCATEMIDLRSIPKPCTINLTKAQWCSDGAKATVRYYVADASGTALANGVTTPGATNYFTVVDNSTADNGDVAVTVTSEDVGYIRFSGSWANAYSDSSNTFAEANTKATLTYTPVA